MNAADSALSAVVATLTRTPLFASVSEDMLRRIVVRSVTQDFERDEILFRAGDIPQHLHVLLEGTVQLSAATPGGREAVVELLRPIDVFLMAATLVSQPYLLSARTVEPSRILLIPLKLLLGELRTSPELALTLLGSMAYQYRHLVREIKNLRLRTAAQRLALYLLHLVEIDGSEQAAHLPCDKKLLADRLGMTPESLSRAISELRQHGVDVRGEQVRITDAQELREFCRLDQMLDALEQGLQVLVPSADSD
jgi:CRP/FNR family transcriptional activator FtrB